MGSGAHSPPPFTMALPFDALTAALDAWLGQHIPSETRRARVRRAVDCLDDLRTAPLAHIEFATDLSSWRQFRLRFLRALRELRTEPVARARRDARVGRWVSVYWPGDARWYRGRVTTQRDHELTRFLRRRRGVLPVPRRASLPETARRRSRPKTRRSDAGGGGGQPGATLSFTGSP